MATEVEERRIPIGELKLGMWVCRLDRSWLGTPFGLQGFRVTNVEQINRLSEVCSDVYIDIVKCIDMTPPELLRRTGPDVHERIGPLHPVDHADTSTLDEEAPRARAAVEVAEAAVESILDDVRRGRKLAGGEVHRAVAPIVGSVLRNADAFLWINSLRQHDDYAYRHAINCSALFAAFGRHLGFPEPVLMSLASGGLLLDIGKLHVPREILASPGPLTDAQQREMRQHVDHGLRVLTQMGVRSDEVRLMVQSHHERFDGSGYPHGVFGKQIPLFGRMAAAIDSYDAMTSERPYSPARSRHDALQQLYRDVGKYQPEVVEQFTQCLGVYPTGSLVELNTGEVAVVVAQNRRRALKPRVMILTAPDRQLHDSFQSLDLMNQAENDDSGSTVSIVRPLAPGAYGLDPTELLL